MRKLKLLLAAFALFGVSAAWAQTDVTGTYLTNPGFEGDSQQFLKINSDGRGVQKPVGWSVEWTQESSSGHNGMTYVGSMTQDDNTWSAHGGDKAYFTRMRWESATLNLRQTMSNLRPGSYTLSFYATASKLSDGNGSASVSVAGQVQDITVGTSTGTNWTQYSINFTVTSSTPYATIEVTAARTGGNFKFGIDDFTLTYDGSSYYSTILTAAGSLYDDNVDWAEDADDLRAAITAATGKETVADKNAAIIALEEAMATFKEANTVDMTSRITNATFDSNISDWTTTGSDGTFQHQTSSQNNFTGGFLESWRNGWNGGYNHKNFDVYQTLSSLPNGEYTIKAAIIAVMQGSKEDKTSGTWEYQNMKHGGPYYIDDSHGVWLYGTSGETTKAAWANTKNSAFDGDGAEYKTATITVSNGSLTIGFKGVGSAGGGTSLGTYANWIACDNWSLSYFGFDPTALKAEISSLKDEAAALLENSDYDNVTGSERTDLIGVASLTFADEKKGTLDALISTIEGRISAFTSAKTSYDALASARTEGATYTTVVWPRASAAKKTALDNAIAAAAPTDAADAVTKTNAIVTAYRQFVESNGLAEGVAVAIDKTSELLVYDADVSTSGWTTGSIGTNYGEKYTKGDGTQPDKYFDGGWSSSAGVAITLTQNLTLPAGQYQLQITARGASNLNSYSMSIGGQSVNLPTDGSTGGTFGNGWSDKFLTFESTGSALTLTIAAASTEYYQWISFNRLRLVRLDATLADATDYSYLNGAIDAADAKTLGFEDGEYAPYANAAALAKLAEAKAINQSANNEQSVVQGLTTYLNTAGNWHANDGDVDAIFNGSFSSDVEGDWGLTGWTRTNSWGQQRDDVSGGYGYYNQPGSLKYGDTGVYTMPLKANTIYNLTFKYASWEDNSNDGMTVSVLNSEDGMAAMNFEANKTKYTNGLVTKSLVFVTGAAGNYVLTLANSGNTVITDVSITKAASQILEFTDGSIPSYAPGTYPSVKITRTLTANRWATAVYPFAVSGVNNIAVLDSYNKETGAIGFTSAAASTANVPFLMRSTSGTSEISLSDVAVAAAEATDAVKSEASLKGTYTSTDITNAEKNFVLSNNNIYSVGAAGATIDPYRAYIQIAQDAPARDLTFTIDGVSTSIEGIKTTQSDIQDVYNLNGQRIQTPTKGLYIMNGKKMVVK